MDNKIIEVEHLQTAIGKQDILVDVNLTINQGDICAIIGGSGSGKTTLLRNILMLLQPKAGVVRIFGKDIYNLTPQEIITIKQRWGMLFQHSALFSGLTVLENIMFPMQEFTNLPLSFQKSLAAFKLKLVGLPEDAGEKFPAELSGGMQRRAAMARAIAMDPELLFLDEPTTGLDPISAQKFYDLILFLKRTLNLTVVMITHDVDSLKRCADKIAFIGEGKVLAIAPYEKLKENKHPLIANYFNLLEV